MEMCECTCPWCGLKIFRDDAVFTIYHEVPECARFKMAVDAVTSESQEVILLVVTGDNQSIHDVSRRRTVGVN